MASVIVDIVIPADQYVKQYQLAGAVVAARSRDGRLVHFPANILQRYVNHSGIAGSFEISFDEAGKFRAISRLD